MIYPPQRPHGPGDASLPGRAFAARPARGRAARVPSSSNPGRLLHPYRQHARDRRPNPPRDTAPTSSKSCRRCPIRKTTSRPSIRPQREARPGFEPPLRAKARYHSLNESSFWVSRSGAQPRPASSARFSQAMTLPARRSSRSSPMAGTGLGAACPLSLSTRRRPSRRRLCHRSRSGASHPRTGHRWLGALPLLRRERPTGTI